MRRGRVGRIFPIRDTGESSIVLESWMFREGTHAYQGVSRAFRKYLKAFMGSSLETWYSPHPSATDDGAMAAGRIPGANSSRKYLLWVESRDACSLNIVFPCARMTLPSQYQKSSSLMYYGELLGAVSFNGC